MSLLCDWLHVTLQLPWWDSFSFLFSLRFYFILGRRLQGQMWREREMNGLELHDVKDKKWLRKRILSGIIIWLYMWYIFIHSKFMLLRVQCWDNKTQFPDSDIKPSNLISFAYMIYPQLILIVWWHFFRVCSRKVLYFTQYYFDF